MTINWQDVVTAVGVTVGGGVTLLGAAAWLIKTALTHRLTVEAEEFKTKLKTDADAQIEHLKSSLQMTALEHQVRFSKLHEKRAEVIAELYKRLLQVASETARFVKASGGLPEELQRNLYISAQKNVDELSQYFETHRIYMPTSACALLDKFVGTMNSAVIDVGLHGGMTFPKDEWEQTAIQDVFTKAYETVEHDIPEIKNQLDAEFREILGEEYSTG